VFFVLESSFSEFTHASHPFYRCFGFFFGFWHGFRRRPCQACSSRDRREGKKGDERKAFMKDCLSANKQEKQQNKMKTCNAEAAGKKGDERKAFMSECLKK
jgi:hypothetical protein